MSVRLLFLFRTLNSNTKMYNTTMLEGVMLIILSTNRLAVAEKKKTILLVNNLFQCLKCIKQQCRRVF